MHCLREVKRFHFYSEVLKCTKVIIHCSFGSILSKSITQNYSVIPPLIHNILNKFTISLFIYLPSHKFNYANLK